VKPPHQGAGSRPPALVVGTGFGCRTIVPALRAAGFDVVGLVGADAERTRQRAEANAIKRAFADLDDAIAATGAKVVAVATPPNTHAVLSMLAISRGCHVLCEKPLAMNAGEAQVMLDAAQRAHVVHLVGHEFRWMPDRAIVARAIADGLIGQPKLLSLLQFMPLVANPEAKMPHWWFDMGAGGGWLGAHGSHLIDQVRSWLGEFASLSAALPMVSARNGVAEDSYAVRFQLAGGVEGMLQNSAGTWGSPASMARVAGTAGTLWSEGGTVRIADRNGTRELPIPADLALPPLPAASDPAGQRAAPPELTCYTRLCEALRAAMDGSAASGPVPPATFADGLAGMRVLDAIRASAAHGGALMTLP
jgi:predicted dehydrogenase